MSSAETDSVRLSTGQSFVRNDNLRRVSVMGPGGITREKLAFLCATFTLQYSEFIQLGRLGPNIGLVTI